jgi:hypothetical protein
MGLARPEVKPFNAKEIELAATFADQAVIAIENTRLFEAEQERTRELTESLEQQTATSEVLQVISSSPGDLEPVFAAMLQKAVRICGAAFGNIYRWDGGGPHCSIPDWCVHCWGTSVTPAAGAISPRGGMRSYEMRTAASAVRVNRFLLLILKNTAARVRAVTLITPFQFEM